jgi:hypothetical protein
MKAKNSHKRVATKSAAHAQLTGKRTHAGQKAPKGANGETGSVGVGGKKKNFILRRSDLTTFRERIDS